MSGGEFNYAQNYIRQIADDIEELISSNNTADLKWKYSDETIEEYKAGVAILRKAFIYAQRIDWLESGDDSEKSFHTRLKTDLAIL